MKDFAFTNGGFHLRPGPKDAGDRLGQRLPVRGSLLGWETLSVGWWGGGLTGTLCLVRSNNKMISESHGNSGPAVYHLLPLVYTKVWVSSWGAHLSFFDKHSWWKPMAKKIVRARERLGGWVYAFFFLKKIKNMCVCISVRVCVRVQMCVCR